MHLWISFLKWGYTTSGSNHHCKAHFVPGHQISRLRKKAFFWSSPRFNFCAFPQRLLAIFTMTSFVCHHQNFIFVFAFDNPIRWGKTITKRQLMKHSGHQIGRLRKKAFFWSSPGFNFCASSTNPGHFYDDIICLPPPEFHFRFASAEEKQQLRYSWWSILELVVKWRHRQ